MPKNRFFNIAYTKQDNKILFTYRSGNMVYEELFSDGALTTFGYNASGYSNLLLVNCPSGINRKRFTEPFCFNLEIDGQSIDYNLEFIDFSVNEDESYATSILTLKSNIKPVTLKVITTVDGSEMFTRHIEIENTTENYYNLSRISLLSGALEETDITDINENATHQDLYTLGYFANDNWGMEGQFKWNTLQSGETSIDGRFTRNRFRHPIIFIKNNVRGEMWYCQIGWSGGYKFSVDYNQKPYQSNTYLSFKAELTGHNPLLVLKPKEVFVTPNVHMGFTHGDLDKAVNEMHSHIRKSVLNLKEADPSPALINCGMGAEHTMNVEDTKAFIRQFKEMGGEVFTVDAGWVCPPGKQMNWSDYNGRNIPDKERYPKGLTEISDYCHEKGLKFGLWVDIESMGEYAPIHQEKPQWLTVDTFGEKSHKFMDLSIPECAQWCESELTRIIEEYNLDLLRVDHNVDYTEYFCMRDTGAGYPECVCIRHNTAVYKMYERLKKKFPHIIFENCAGGGGRTDLGMMKSFNHTWVSDNQKMPHSVSVTNGMTMALPPERVDRLFAGMGCHSFGELKAHMRNTMLGHVSLNVVAPAHLTPNSEHIKFVKHCTDIYKSFIRPFLPECKLYHHTPDLTVSKIAVNEIAAKDKSRSAITVISLAALGGEETVVKPKGIDVGSSYKVTLDNENSSFNISGFELKNKGINIYLDSDLTSELVLIEKI